MENSSNFTEHLWDWKIWWLIHLLYHNAADYFMQFLLQPLAAREQMKKHITLKVPGQQCFGGETLRTDSKTFPVNTPLFFQMTIINMWP